MWRNTDVEAFIEALRAYNAERPLPQRAGFYGLDLYNMSASIRAVLDYEVSSDNAETPAAVGEALNQTECDRLYDELAALVDTTPAAERERIVSDLKVWAAGVKGEDELAGIGGLETNKAHQWWCGPRYRRRATIASSPSAIAVPACCPAASALCRRAPRQRTRWRRRRHAISDG